MLVNIFLSSFFPLTQELFQNPNLSYLFQTLNLTHTLLNVSNPQLAEDSWICLGDISGISGRFSPSHIQPWLDRW